MSKRLSTAAIGFAFACSIGSAQAGPYFGFDGRHYGELENAPNFGRPKTSEHGKGSVFTVRLPGSGDS